MPIQLEAEVRTSGKFILNFRILLRCHGIQRSNAVSIRIPLRGAAAATLAEAQARVTVRSSIAAAATTN